MKEYTLKLFYLQDDAVLVNFDDLQKITTDNYSEKILVKLEREASYHLKVNLKMDYKHNLNKLDSLLREDKIELFGRESIILSFRRQLSSILTPNLLFENKKRKSHKDQSSNKKARSTSLESDSYDNLQNTLIYHDKEFLEKIESVNRTGCYTDLRKTLVLPRLCRHSYATFLS